MNADGFSLITALVFVAVVSIAAMAVATLVQGVDSSTQRLRLSLDAESAARYAQAIVNDRTLCSDAIWNGGGRLTYNGGPTVTYSGGGPHSVVSCAVAPSIQFDTLRLGAQVALQKGCSAILPQAGVACNAGQGPILTNMCLIPVGPTTSTITIDGNAYNTYPFIMRLEFGAADSQIVTEAQNKPIMLAAKTTDYVMDKCAATLPSNTNLGCQGSTILTADSNCAQAQPSGSCQQFYHVQGFNADGSPMCACNWICTAN